MVDPRAQENGTYYRGEVAGELRLNLFGPERLDLLLELPLALLLLGDLLDPSLELDDRVQTNLKQKCSCILTKQMKVCQLVLCPGLVC